MGVNMLDERLLKVSQYIEGKVLCDIGSDHAHLPIYTLQNGFVERAICGEIVEGPYDASVKNVKNHGLTEKISVRLGDGLSILSDDDRVDTVTVCGMGGPLIASILNDGLSQLSMRPKLVLQANTYTYPVRQVLKDLNYKILDEDVVRDKHYFYEIIVANYDEKTIDYTERELKFGPINLQRKSLSFREKLMRECEHQEMILEQIKASNNHKKIIEVEQKIIEIKDVLKDEG